MTLFTIGHSTRSLDEFVDVLRAHGVKTLVDIRTIRRSRANPQFDEAALGPALAVVGMRYEKLASLGGLRHGMKDQQPSQSSAWQNESFRHYADYATTAPFRGGLDALVRLAAREPTAIMCAEALWWRCHRRIVADHLLARGVAVVHLFTKTHAEPATLTPFAVIDQRGAVTYPAKEIHMVHLKRAYEPAKATDGRRVLVERLWPRGLRREQAHFDDWLKDVAPSGALRTWFHHEPKRWEDFERRYARELRTGAARAALDELVRWAASETVTLIYAAHDEEHNNALILKRMIERRLRRRSRGPARPTQRHSRRATA